MRWEGDRESDNIEDRRGGGGGGGFGFGGGTVGIGTVVIAVIASWFFGVSPSTILGLLSGGGQAPVQTQSHPPANDPETRFVRTVLAYTEDVWTQQFQANGARYVPPKLVLFTGRTATACGTGQSATGPFYCPADQKVYIDLSFFQLMQQRFHVSGEFSQAYVIAHEVGHHVQNLLGISDKVDNARQHAASEGQSNALSVRLELQADCLAGVWANHANQMRSILEQGDVETALNAASAIGDDKLQQEARGVVVPDSFTHGTSAQRVRWFRRGIESGKMEQCDTFGAREL